jgi:hypothetical protein
VLFGIFHKRNFHAYRKQSLPANLKPPGQILIVQSKRHQDLRGGFEVHFQIFLFIVVFSALYKKELWGYALPWFLIPHLEAGEGATLPFSPFPTKNINFGD